MFTGIVEAVGAMVEVTSTRVGARMVIAHPVAGELNIGDSISVNGCCVTVTDRDHGRFGVDLMGETLRRTALGRLRGGAAVNLERAMAVDGRFGGHLVQGHVDAVGTITEVTDHDGWTVMAVSADRHVAPFLVEKGSIAIDGTSLTVMEVRADGEGVVFEVGLIPHTLAVTVLGTRAVGDPVNLEVDVVAKYVKRLLSAGVATPYAVEHLS